MQPFAPQVCDFLDALSKELREDEEAGLYSDIMTFAFWIRRSNLMKMKDAYREELRIGKGLVFHIAPSNVPINFAYTFVFGLLSGNANVVKASSKNFPQTEVICRVMRQLALREEYRWVFEQNAIVVYGRECVELTEQFSWQCDIRIIWGGDVTIQEVRKAPLLPRSTEITFADRYSFGIISANAILEIDEQALAKVAERFYNDTYLMDQNACSTPHLICWCGDEACVEKASNRFWKQVYEIVKLRYSLEDIKVSEKYTIFCEMAAEGQVIKLKKFENYLYVGTIPKLPEDISNLRGKFGSFYEYHLKDFEELSDCINAKVQTCAIYGMGKEYIAEWLQRKHLCGIDRIVPIGKTLDIGLVWDGYDIIRTLSRRVMV